MESETKSCQADAVMSIVKSFQQSYLLFFVTQNGVEKRFPQKPS